MPPRHYRGLAHVSREGHGSAAPHLRCHTCALPGRCLSSAPSAPHRPTSSRSSESASRPAGESCTSSRSESTERLGPTYPRHTAPPRGWADPCAAQHRAWRGGRRRPLSQPPGASAEFPCLADPGGRPPLPRPTRRSESPRAGSGRVHPSRPTCRRVLPAHCAPQRAARPPTTIRAAHLPASGRAGLVRPRRGTGSRSTGQGQAGRRGQSHGRMGESGVGGSGDGGVGVGHKDCRV